MNGNVLFSAARLPAPSLPPSVWYHGFLPSRCSQLFPFLSLELSRAAFIPPPQHTSSPWKLPHSMIASTLLYALNRIQLGAAYWSWVGNPPLQSNLPLVEECGGILLYFLLPTAMPTRILTPSKPGPPALVPPFLSISDEADFSVSQTLITWNAESLHFN